MTEVGILEAKTHLSRLVERAERGEEIVITRHGRPVAKIVAALSPERPRRPIEELRKKLLEFGKGNRLPEGMTIKDLIDEGRRF